MKINLKPQPNWGRAYEVFDGTMAPCLGKACDASCCHLRYSPTPEWVGPKQHITSMISSEHDFQLSAFGQFPDGVETELVDVGSEGQTDIRYLVRNCLSDDGSCRLKNRKPILCRMFPFSTSAFLPLEFRDCPKAKVIAADPEIQKQIIRVRRALGFTDSEEWQVSLERILHILQKRGK